ncbi:MAG: hypothetical protein UR28_C0007G0015 [Candidatus Peregrinibacteria bacterium GW2011_GWF2_33_10]|nr:MAG: hypothetical protein UR28_C0007G0015 [Candidatus Peregrinibacteria bacterium GW2011_GWF2_33_10]OGJ44246.1 MAG: hypothetical protein A2272_04120 [Candidatus Peregrinibacteria bacterium RIFOXYA12_FULL_33_12]OGJ44904.1 MAG: hypothetical protein A2263_03185 [Candidatus Peregrinibacteria bacterium RIFOXYA2_FULL_33_21]OGJ50663.1 MAG: hypothetical protein A2307_03475 [Candidatus Peregrinibacteria bacterium RIFOXYB2_FULL_33_20]
MFTPSENPREMSPNDALDRLQQMSVQRVYERPDIESDITKFGINKLESALLVNDKGIDIKIAQQGTENPRNVNLVLFLKNTNTGVYTIARLTTQNSWFKNEQLRQAAISSLIDAGLTNFRSGNNLKQVKKDKENDLEAPVDLNVQKSNQPPSMRQSGRTFKRGHPNTETYTDSDGEEIVIDYNTLRNKVLIKGKDGEGRPTIQWEINKDQVAEAKKVLHLEQDQGYQNRDNV